MKKIIFFFTIAVVANNACSQDLKDSEVPEAIKSKLNSTYTGLTKIRWEKEGGFFEAEFKKNSQEISVIFDTVGNIVQTEFEIPISSLPSTATKYLAKILNGKTLKEAIKIVKSNGDVGFETEIGETEYLFDEKGNFLKSENDTSENDD